MIAYSEKSCLFLYLLLLFSLNFFSSIFSHGIYEGQCLGGWVLYANAKLEAMFREITVTHRARET